jgi:hypothetical protein
MPWEATLMSEYAQRRADEILQIAEAETGITAADHPGLRDRIIAVIAEVEEDLY